MPSKERYSELFFGAAPYIENDIEGFRPIQKLYFRKYSLDQCRYWDRIVIPGSSWIPEVKINYILLAKRYLFESDWRPLDEWNHVADWFFVRTMAANEINTYFH